MICLQCQRAGDASRLSSEFTLAHMFRRELWYKAKTLHAMCAKVDCYCQHMVKAVT
jgi:hypothetical protein